MLPPPTETTAKHWYTGAILYGAADGVRKLQVRVGDRGRGLFAASLFKKGDIVTEVAGVLMDTQNPNVVQHLEKYQWSKSQVFVMNPAKGALGIFANTAASVGINNARFLCNRRNQTMRIRAERNILDGQEILVPYGRTYASQVKEAVRLKNCRILEDRCHNDVTAPVVVAGGAVARLLCAKCRKRLTKNSRQTHARCCSGAISTVLRTTADVRR
jgi:hypothetical protein